MELVKWSSILNSYRKKELSRWLERNPQLIEAEYFVSEKLNGSNVQLCAYPDGEIGYGLRNQWLDPTETFFGCFPRDLGDLLPGWNRQFFEDELIGAAKLAGEPIRLYGELFGLGIQKSVSYGDIKRILWFGLKIGNELQSTYELVGLVGLEYTVPIIDRIQGLTAALEYNTDFPSKLNPTPDNLCEGVVIVPAIPVRSQDSWFMLKKKNEKFAERAHAKKERVPDEVADPLNLAFREYITDTRMRSVFSKDGPIEDRSDIGRYIKAILADAKEDFIQDYPEVVDLDKAQQKTVYNVGSMIAKMLEI